MATCTVSSMSGGRMRCRVRVWGWRSGLRLISSNDTSPCSSRTQRCDKRVSSRLQMSDAPATATGRHGGNARKRCAAVSEAGREDGLAGEKGGEGEGR